MNAMDTPLTPDPEPMRDGPQDCGAFFLDATGPFDRTSLEVSWRQQPRPRRQDVEELIDQAWTQRQAKAQRDGANLFNGPLCRLVAYDAREHQLRLHLGPTCYRDFVGTNLHNAHLRYSHSPEVLANPLGVSANIVLAEGFLLLGRRSQRVAYHAGRIHPIGGCVEPAPEGASPEPFDSIRQELHEELAIPAEHIRSLRCLGLIRDKHIVQPELIFDAAVSCSFEQIQQNLPRAEHADEHVDLLIVRDHPASVVTFIESHYSELTPVALSGLLLHGLHCWGSGWFASTRGYLRSLI
jgi:hypothetical protein